MTASRAALAIGGSVRSNSVACDPFRDPFGAPLTSLKRPPVGHCSGDSCANWDGTPAHPSGARGLSAGGTETGRWRQRGGAT